MHVDQYIVELKAERFIKLCRRGFDNEHAHKAWMRAHILEMEAWPETLRFAVVAAWMNSGPKEMTSQSESPKGPQE